MNEELVFLIVMVVVFVPFTFLMDRWINEKWFWQKEKEKIQPKKKDYKMNNNITIIVILISSLVLIMMTVGTIFQNVICKNSKYPFCKIFSQKLLST